MSKPKLTIFLENKVGGLQFYFSTLVDAGAFDQFDLRYIALDRLERLDARLPAPLPGAPMELFPMLPSENLYHLFRRLDRRLPREPGIILTNNYPEIGCLDVYPQPDQTIIYFCHDQGFVERAILYAHVIDLFVAHNPYFADLLTRKLPPDRAKDVLFLPFGIKQDKSIRRQPNRSRPLKIIFIGRLHREKGILDLPLIDDHLREAGVTAEWSILGTGHEKTALEKALGGRTNFVIESPRDSREMLVKAAQGDVFAFPSRVDGTPLALMEAMSVGLVPVVSEFNPGAHWMVPSNAGFVCPLEPRKFAAILAQLDTNREELESRSEASFNHAIQEFNIDKKVQDYSHAFARFCGYKAPTLKRKSKHGGPFDQPWLPNFATTTYRKWIRGVR